MSENFKSFLQMDLSPYLGEWVAISGNKVLGHSKDINELKKELKKRFIIKNLINPIL